MGDMTKEPSMEEILSSIKRIIAEEGDEAARASAPRTLRRGRNSPAVEEDAEPTTVLHNAQVDEVLELTEAFDSPESIAPVEDAHEGASNIPEPQEMAKREVKAPPATEPSDPAAMLSVESEIAARHSLSTLSAMLVKPQAGGDNTLEALVRELLRPMMKQWLDTNLPGLVETMVAKEIARITGREI